MKIRTGYSFRTAVGHLADVADRLQTVAWAEVAPISDRNSTFGFTRWTKIVEKRGLRPIYGVELACVPELGAKKPRIDYWTFFAIDQLEPLHALIERAGRNPGRDPSLLYTQAMAAEGVVKIAGERLLVEHLPEINENFYIGLSPATPKGLVKRANARKLPWIATSDNVYPRIEDREFYRITLGWRANTQSYPQHILDSDEWTRAVKRTADDQMIVEALANRLVATERCQAQQLKAELLHPQRPAPLRPLCQAGAQKKGIDLSDPVYAERLDRELSLIAQKEFEDYFYILADMIQWAKERMVVGPARGSSCGSLVCYLLDITSIDPIPFGLIFERFIDLNRADLPDIDVDFSDERRHLVFEYAEQRFGAEHVARLGTVGMFKPRSAVNQAGASLRIPRWRTNKVMDYIIERSSGDSRAMNALEDTLHETEAGKALIEEHPEILIAQKMEGHPNVASQHAAGVLVTDKPMREYVAVDPRTGAAMCDKKDSEALNLLKIDALGLTQLSVFERCLELIGQEPRSGWLETLPLDDPAAFAVLNEKRFSGIFQFTGTALRSLASQVHYTQFSDIVATTALARPGPLATGGAMSWIRRKAGQERAESIHPMLTELTKETFGVVVYQEQVMRVVREMGQMTWEDTSAIRKAMSGRLGDEFFAKYRLKFLEGAAFNGVDETTADAIWKQINTFGCLSGETKLLLPGSNQYSPKEISMENLWKNRGWAKTATPSNRSAQDKRPKALLWSFSEKIIHGKRTILPERLNKIVYSGRQWTTKLTTESGKSIRATHNHKFLTKKFEWKRLAQLKIGDEILVMGKKQRSKKWKGVGSGAHNHWHGESKKFIEQVKHLKKLFNTCQNCLKAPYEETHHIDGDRMNNEIKNLMPVCRPCHKSFHEKPSRNSRGHRYEIETIVSLSDSKIEDTYDISMEPNNNFIANGFITHNSWAFNLSHAVSYGMVSYWCCWLKAHHPLAFAAATLDAEKDPEKQINLLRELAQEGIDYAPFDPNKSTDRWVPDGKRLIGPITNIHGIGPAKMREILDCRERGEELRPSILKQLENAKTPIDSLYPIRDRIRKLHPDLAAINIFTLPTDVAEVQPGVRGDVVILARVNKIAPKDENEAVGVMKRGGKILTGPTNSLNLFFADDSGEIFCKVNRFDYHRLAPKIINQGRAGKSLYAIKGSVPPDFRMIKVKQMRYLGEME